jgi:hypothetical protein
MVATTISMGYDISTHGAAQLVVHITFIFSSVIPLLCTSLSFVQASLQRARSQAWPRHDAFLIYL